MDAKRNLENKCLLAGSQCFGPSGILRSSHIYLPIFGWKATARAAWQVSCALENWRLVSRLPPTGLEIKAAWKAGRFAKSQYPKEGVEMEFNKKIVSKVARKTNEFENKMMGAFSNRWPLTGRQKVVPVPVITRENVGTNARKWTKFAYRQV